jgi:hypothetical protein
METVKWDGDGLVCRRSGALAVADGCRSVSVTGSAEDGPRRRDVWRISTRAHAEQGARRRGAAADDGAAQSGSGRRAHGGVRCPTSPATSFTQGARSSTPGHRRDPLVLGPWLPRAPRHAHDSLRRGELDAWLQRAPPGLPQASRGRGELGTWPQASSASAAVSSGFGRRKLLAAPRHGELGAWPPTSSTPECTGGPQQAAPPCAGREARFRDPCPWIVVVVPSSNSCRKMGSTSIFFLQADPLPQYLCRPPVNLAVNRLKSLLSLPALAFVTLLHACPQ